MASSYGKLSNSIAAGSAYPEVSTWAVDKLRKVVAGHSPLRAVSHPLGFVCLPLERSGQFGVCLHFWTPATPDGAGLTTSQIHAHSWELESCVLYGELWNQRFQVQDAVVAASGNLRAPGNSVCRVVEVRSQDGTDELLPTERIVGYAPEQPTVVRTGESYSLPAEAFHVTWVDARSEVVTVALGKTVEGARNQSLGPLNSTAHTVRRQYMSVTETVTLAKSILDRLPISPAHAVNAISCILNS